jgi:recombination protein RecR
MTQKILPPSLLGLVNELTRFPGIGEKSAIRMVLFILRKDKELLKVLSDAFLSAYQKIAICKRCCNIAEAEFCEICTDPKREEGLLCVVEDTGDLISIEKSGQFKGRYHVLAGLVSPIKNKKFEDLTIDRLRDTILQYGIKELIFALNPTVEGEATTLYIRDFLKDMGVKITRIAYGIPMGSDIEYLDEVTMAVAIQGRQEIE